MRRLELKQNKKGQIRGILYFFIALFVLIFVGFLMSIGVAITDWTADEIIPELTTLTKGSGSEQEFTNLTKNVEYVSVPANNFVQALPGIIGALYVVCLVGSLGLAYAFRTTDQKWLLGLFFVLTLIVVLSAIGISIIYEDFYDDTGDLGDRLREQTLMSFLILYSPALLTMVAVIGAMIMFTGGGVEI